MLFQNPYRGQRLSDENTAALTLLDAAAAWAHGENSSPYPLAHGSQDHLMALAINEAAKLGTTVITSREACAKNKTLAQAQPDLLSTPTSGQ